MYFTIEKESCCREFDLGGSPFEYKVVILTVDPCTLMRIIANVVLRGYVGGQQPSEDNGRKGPVAIST